MAGFSRISTRRSASSAVIRPPDSMTSDLTSSNARHAGGQRVTGSLVTTDFITFHSGAMSFLGDALVISLPDRLDIVFGSGLPRLFCGGDRHGVLQRSQNRVLWRNIVKAPRGGNSDQTSE